MIIDAVVYLHDDQNRRVIVTGGTPKELAQAVERAAEDFLRSQSVVGASEGHEDKEDEIAERRDRRGELW